MISGGDVYQLAPKQITLIGEALLAIPHVRRMRFATKGPAVMPKKILTDEPWSRRAHPRGRARAASWARTSCCTRTSTTRTRSRDHAAAMDMLFERGITVRNQSVLIRGVNDDAQR